MRSHFLVIGAQRSGTTYLHALLEAHPDIAMARPTRPEPKVFMSKELTGRGLEWYHATYFGHATTESVLGEKSTSYIEVPAAATLARSVLSEASIVALLRDPVERAVSNWRFSTDNGYEARPLHDALRANLASGTEWDPTATSVSPFAYLERGRFAQYLEPWLEVFPGRVRIVFLADLLSDGSTLSGVYAALGVDADFVPERGGRALNQSTQPPPRLDPGLLRDLREYFADSDRTLSALVGRELPWPTLA